MIITLTKSPDRFVHAHVPSQRYPLPFMGMDPSLDIMVIMFLLSSMEQIHLQIATSTPCLSAPCVITSSEVLSEDVCISRKAPEDIYLRSVALSLHRVTTYEVQCQWILRFGRHVGFDAEDAPSVHSP
jgi:hypothetical protein